MSLDAVLDRLDHHAGNTNGESGVASFVGMLKPYAGLRTEAYDDLMHCLQTIAPLLRESSELPRRLMASLWGIVWYPRYWATMTGSMVRRNGLMQPDDQQRLEQWVDQVQHTVSQLLDGASDAEAFAAP